MQEFREIRIVLRAEIKDKKGIIRKALCKIVECADGKQQYLWFFEDTIEGGFVPNEKIAGSNLDEARSSFEIVYGMLEKDKYRVRAGKWYQYPNTF
jgi:hypothetical protein